MNASRFEYDNFLTSGAHVGLLALGVHLDSVIGWLLVCTSIAVISLFAWSANYRRSRAVGDTPTSRVASAHQGYVELFGRARNHPGHETISPASQRPCVWFRYLIERRESNNEWCRELAAVSSETFILQDDTGGAVIDPDGAEIVTSDKRVWRIGDRRYSEWLLTPQDRLYALGEFVTVGGASAPLDPSADVSSLLAEWKADPGRLKARFDLDGDGQVDLKEWELARRAARREIGKHHQQIRSESGTHVLRQPHDDRLFLLSNIDPDKLARRYALWTMLQLGIALAAGGGILFLLGRAGGL